MLYELCKLCAKSYCEKLTQLSEDERVTMYFEDTKKAAGVDDLEMLLVLDAVPGEAQLIVPVEFDEFLLSYYVAFFKRAIDKHEISTSQMLFERILDTSESGLDIYTWVIDEIFSMGKGPEWYAPFFHGVHKLLVRAPVNHETLRAMKKGLTGTSKDIKEEIEGIIAYTYENRREIGTRFFSNDIEGIKYGDLTFCFRIPYQKSTRQRFAGVRIGGGTVLIIPGMSLCND